MGGAPGTGSDREWGIMDSGWPLTICAFLRRTAWAFAGEARLVID